MKKGLLLAILVALANRPVTPVSSVVAGSLAAVVFPVFPISLLGYPLGSYPPTPTPKAVYKLIADWLVTWLIGR